MLMLNQMWFVYLLWMSFGHSVDGLGLVFTDTFVDGGRVDYTQETVEHCALP